MKHFAWILCLGYALWITIRVAQGLALGIPLFQMLPCYNDVAEAFLVAWPLLTGSIGAYHHALRINSQSR